MIRPFILSCLLISTAAAAELVVRDIRLGVMTRPSDFDFTMTSPQVEISGSDAFDGGLSIDGGLRWSFAPVGHSFGLVVGADLAMDGQAYGGDGDGLNTLWGKVSAGLGWAVADRVTLIGEGLVGYGLSTLALPENRSTPEYEADGDAIAYEARITGTWQFTRTFNAGLMAGWLVSSHDLSGDDVDLTLDQNGWYAGVVFSWRISDMPQALE